MDDSPLFRYYFLRRLGPAERETRAGCLNNPPGFGIANPTPAA